MNPNVKILGRTPAGQGDFIPLFWTGSGALFRIQASSLSFLLESADSVYEQWIRIELDGVTILRTSLQPGLNNVTVFRGIDKAQTHLVQLYKEVQAMAQDETAWLLLRDIQTDGEILPPPPFEHRLEFIGDSLTSGEGLACETHFMDWVSCMFSTEGSFPQILAKRLNAEIRVLSQSGWGALSSWDGNENCTMYPGYREVCGLLTGKKNALLGAHEPNDFSWTPEAIIINLGTNDGSACQNCADQGDFKRRLSLRVIAFLEQIRACNPDALILWAYGMCGHVMEDTLQNAVHEYAKKTGDRATRYVHLPAASKEEMGSRQHPGRPSHQKCADVLYNELAGILTI